MTPVIQRHASREAWLDARRGMITGTTAAAILGVSPWSSPWDVYAREVLDQASDGPAPEIAARGYDLEPVAAARWVRARRAPSGCYLLDPGDEIVTVTRAERPGWLASPDGLVLDETGRIVGGTEYKTVSRSDLGRFWCDDDPEPSWVRHLDGVDVHPGDDGAHVPPGWLVQILVYLEITGADWWDLVVVGPHLDHTSILRIWRQPEAQSGLVGRCDDWWTRHILAREAPPVDGSEACARAMRATWPPAARHRLELISDVEVEDLAARYLDAAAREDRAATERGELRALLTAAVGGTTARAMTAGHIITIDRRGALKVTARRTT